MAQFITTESERDRKNIVDCEFMCRLEIYNQYLYIYQESLKLQGIISEKSGSRNVIQWCFCTKMNKNWRIASCTTPVFKVDRISLLKTSVAFRPIVEVIKCLIIVKCLIVIPKS